MNKKKFDHKKYYKEHSASYKESHNKYMEDNKYVELKVRMTESYREAVKEHASFMGESARAFICRAIDETIKRDNKKKSANKDKAAKK